MALELLLMLGLILLNGFFSLAEMALVSSRKARLRAYAEQGEKNYRLALDAAESPGPFLSSIQVAITLIGILTGAIGGATISRNLALWLSTISIFKPIAGPLSVGIVVLLTTLLSVILGELVPKSLALARPESIAARVIRPLRAIGLVFSPLVRFLTWTTQKFVRLSGVEPLSDPEVTEDEVKVLIAQGTETGVFENSEKEMVEGVLDLDDRRVTAFMTPRTDVVTVDLHDDPAVLRATILDNTRFSAIPVVEGDLDRISGMLPVRDALAAMVEAPAGSASVDLSSLLVRPVLIPETLSALKALSILRDQGAGTGLIVDEYGGVSGLVTLSDLLGSVLAGLEQDDEASVPGITKRSDGSLLVDGALSIEDFAGYLEMDEGLFDGDAYETVAGFVLYCMGSIPRAGDRCESLGLSIEIMDMDGNRIDKVLVSKEPAQIPPEPEI